jgi:hypothetical protein
MIGLLKQSTTPSPTSTLTSSDCPVGAGLLHRPGGQGLGGPRRAFAATFQCERTPYRFDPVGGWLAREVPYVPFRR